MSVSKNKHIELHNKKIDNIDLLKITIGYIAENIKALSPFDVTISEPYYS